jgi:hypothetical protein
MRTVSSNTEPAGLAGRECAAWPGSSRDEVEAEAEALVELDSGDTTEMDDEVEAFEALLSRDLAALETVSVFGDGLRAAE